MQQIYFRGGSISPMVQFLLTLRYYATGSFLISMGDFMGVSKASASRIVKRVSEAITTLRPRFIRMYNDNREMARSAAEFYQLASFPRVIGAIDCTLIRIESPGGDDAEIFRSRKGFFALNVQTISDANLKIRNIVARWPGSTHDQTIFNNSRIKRDFQNGRYGRYTLVGDSGYSIQPYLMTKLQEVNLPAENLFNESIIRTRNVVETQYGVWKRRFPILSTGIRLNLETAMSVIVATAIIHNIAVELNDDFPDDWFDDPIVEDADENFVGGLNDFHYVRVGANMGRHVRQLIINEHFTRL